MIDPAIEEFFKERNIMSRADWLRDAGKIAVETRILGKPSIMTHPGKFSHPDARITPIMAKSKKQPDGYLRSGNVETEMDASGNAAVNRKTMDVYKFLTLTMKDSKKLIDHIREDSPVAVSLLTIPSVDYETLKYGFLEMVEKKSEQVATDTKIKQVYFPVNDAYHQLSILSNSGLMLELKKRIDYIRYSDEVKELRGKKKNNIYSEQGYLEFYDLTVIGYGGTDIRNISFLNSGNKGEFYLLSSLPPTLKERDIHFPKYNFFRESLREYEYRPIFHALHKLFKTNYNNLNIREGRDYRLQNLIDLIIDRMSAVRSVSAEQYRPESCYLESYQKIWLCPEESQKRQDEDLWLNTLCERITRWIIHTYERLNNQAVKLGEAERKHIEGIVTQYREELR